MMLQSMDGVGFLKAAHSQVVAGDQGSLLRDRFKSRKGL